MSLEENFSMLEAKLKILCDTTDELCSRHAELCNEIAALRIDRDRLDWLDNEALCVAQFNADPEDSHSVPSEGLVRSAIDRAMQPGATTEDHDKALGSIKI